MKLTQNIAYIEHPPGKNEVNLRRVPNTIVDKFETIYFIIIHTDISTYDKFILQLLPSCKTPPFITTTDTWHNSPVADKTHYLYRYNNIKYIDYNILCTMYNVFLLFVNSYDVVLLGLSCFWKHAQRIISI